MSNFNGDFNIIISAPLIGLGKLDVHFAIKYKNLEKKTTLIIIVFSKVA